MRFNKKLAVTGLLVVMIIMGVVLTGLSADGDHYTNLRVLPKNINSKALSHIMVDEFNDGLGVGCGFCHAEEKGSHRLDYASDAKPEKEMARSMMRMTLRVNRKYFQLKHPLIGDPALTVSCSTCHHGLPHPGE